MGHVRRPNYAQRFLLPPSLEEWVGPEHPVRFVRDFVDALDLAKLGIKDPQGEVGRPPVAADVHRNFFDVAQAALNAPLHRGRIR